ncbi:MAG: hypothetical protein E3J90_01410 [Promethearchaeota archaeon]|nr:MAG: hypothetical protein E3J90_01410 [Candidatus Lokiarchaeota archaeon]
MSYFGWIHLIRSKEHADIFWKAIFDSGGYISLFHYGILNGALLTKSGRLFGVEADDDFIETDQDGLLIWSVKYISHEDFYRKLRKRKKKLII